MTPSTPTTGRTSLSQRLTNLFRGKSRRRTHSSASRPRIRPTVEALEERRVPANYLMIDFTPDALPNEYQNDSFASAFALRDNYGRQLGFLDMNGDRVVNNTDVSIAAQQIYNRVAQRLSGFNIQVYGGDLWEDTGLGKAWLNWGLQSPGDQVFTLYVGGWSAVAKGAPSAATGVAIQSPVGYNNEWYALVWTSTQVNNLVSGIGQATASYFVESTAATIVHEFGHLVGLGHVSGNPPDDNFNVMNYWVGTNYPQYAQIPNVTYNNIEVVDGYGRHVYSSQNPAAEMYSSLTQQSSAPAGFHISYATGQTTGYFVHYTVPVTADEAGHNHEHRGTHEDDFTSKEMVVLLLPETSEWGTGSETISRITRRQDRSDKPIVVDDLFARAQTERTAKADLVSLDSPTSRQADCSPFQSLKSVLESSIDLDDPFLADRWPMS